MKQKFVLAAGMLASNLSVAEVLPPFEITEPEATRPRCKHYNPNRKPFFGETHLHTGLSFDASLRYVNTHSGGSV
ncbi:MAG: DUF3604 domain-containing protein [Gammaproteobacteria bacterium]